MSDGESTSISPGTRHQSRPEPRNFCASLFQATIGKLSGSKKDTKVSKLLHKLEKDVVSEIRKKANRGHRVESAIERYCDVMVTLHQKNELRSRNLDHLFAKMMLDDPEVELSPEQKKACRSCVGASRIFSQNRSLDDSSPHGNVAAHAPRSAPRSRVQDPLLKEGDGSEITYTEEVFQNWGETVTTAKPVPTFVPKSKQGLCNIVKWARERSMQVRAAGYRHSWSDIGVRDGQVLVSMLPIKDVVKLPASEPELDPENELQGIEMVGEVVEDGVTKGLCKVGSAVSNDMFRRWVIEKSRDDATKSWKHWWTLPLNVIMVEITFGGSNAPICHGAGLKTQTLSDLVTSIEFVNADGEIQTVNDPLHLQAAAGCFGMLGIVTSLTLKLDILTFANMKPTKPRLALAIPPPKDFPIPENVDMKGITDWDLDDAFNDFVTAIETNYYLEYFWFPGQRNCWVNNWKNNGAPSEAKEYPSRWDAKFQAISSFLAEVANNSLFRIAPPSWQLKLMTSLAQNTLPSDESIVTPLIDALHFRRGIHNMKVYDMEWEIPIPGLKSDPSKPDWSICCDAWWAVIGNFYRRYNKDKNDVPFRLALEMRITGDSNILMAPQRGNKHGTLAIEILSPLNVPMEEWVTFMQETTDQWTELKNIDGSYLNVRPHWAKEWMRVNVRGQDIKEYVRAAYRDVIPVFLQRCGEIAEAGGCSLDDCRRVFGSNLIDQVIREE